MTSTSPFRTTLQFAILVTSDICALLLAFYAALWVRFDGAIPDYYLPQNPLSITVALGAYVVIFGVLRLYRFAWRFASMDTLFSVLLANTFGLAVATGLFWMLDRMMFPRSVIILLWVWSTLLVGALRIAMRLSHLWFDRLHEAPSFGSRRPTNCVILGTGDEAVHAARLLRNRAKWNYRVLGFLDHRTPPAEGYYIFGSKILGGISSLTELAHSTGVDEAIIALPQAEGPEIRKLALECRSLGIVPRVIPSLGDTLQHGALELLPEVSVEDLLRRDPVKIELNIMRSCLQERVVLVTGAGGSIGSELCRQIMRCQPRKLLLLGHGENSIHRIAGELLAKFPEHAGRISQVICDIRDGVQLEHLFAQERPEVVFHAAAHKHVPLMELNPSEAVKNNVGGTKQVATLAGKYGAERFLLISTDKAVNPSSIMGATKWVCEEVVRHLAARYPQTRFITTRFGNVLGSRGSVVPLFKEQIANGGPVTVTHPQMTRYFMTIPEAAQLVLSAAAVGESGQVLVLDMGEPVAILDLAREMIRLAGLEEGTDITIAFTGMRAGEKLHEELFGAGEERLPTPHVRLFLARRPQYLPPKRCEEFIAQLLTAADHWDPDAVCELLASELPTLEPVLREVSLPLVRTTEAA